MEVTTLERNNSQEAPMPWEINRLCFLLALFIFIGPHSPISGQSDKPQPYLPGTKQLNMDGDVASEMVAGIDRFLLKEIEKAEESREKLWRRDFSSRENYLAAIEPHRKKLAHILGVRDKRLEFQGPEKVSIIGEDSRIASTRNFDVDVVRWPVFDGVHADGLLLTPKGIAPRGYVIALPDADHTPEQLIGLVPGLSEEAQFAKILASHGMKVLIPTLIDRSYKPRSGRAKMTNREYIHRSAFELGRLLIGYEIQKTLSGVDWFSKIKKSHEKIAVVGWGEGGLIAFYAAALDPRIEIASVSGYFGNRNQIWQHPLDRNVFGLLEQLGDAQVAGMIAPRCLIIGTVPGPSLDLPSEGGAPSQLRSPSPTDVEREWKRTLEIVSPLKPNSFMFLENEWKSINQQVLKLCGIPFVDKSDTYAPHGKIQDRVYRQDKQLKELDRFNQQLLSESAARRNEFLPLFDQFKSDDKKKKVSTKDLPSFADSMEPFRNHFYTEIIGKFSHELSSPNPRSRLVKETPQWSRYQVLMDVFPGVIAYGILT
ncbi:MAG: dienelactone hydrolase family protein, partial [Gemmataceae bacterium]